MTSRLVVVSSEAGRVSGSSAQTMISAAIPSATQMTKMACQPKR